VTFIAKHNIAFLFSDRAIKLFHNMLPNSEIAKKFLCGGTNTIAVIKEALAPHFLKSNKLHVLFFLFDDG